MTNIAGDKAKKAHLLIKKAVDSGELIRPNECDFCEVRSDDSPIIAHHWQGYNNPLNVLWICSSCNAMLRNKHDGVMTKEELKEYVSSKQKPLGIMKSNIKNLAEAQGINSVTELYYKTKLTWPTIRKFWSGYLDNARLKTMVKVANVLNCSLEDLYIIVKVKE